jgi:hypothetical protein
LIPYFVLPDKKGIGDAFQLTPKTLLPVKVLFINTGELILPATTFP